MEFVFSNLQFVLVDSGPVRSEIASLHHFKVIARQRVRLVDQESQTTHKLRAARAPESGFLTGKARVEAAANARMTAEVVAFMMIVTKIWNVLNKV